MLIIFFAIAAITSCKKNSEAIRPGEFSVPATELNDLRQEVLVEILTMSKNMDFHRYVLNECLKQKHGEYNVYLADIVNNYKANADFKGSIEKIESLIPKIKVLSYGREPLIYYPKAETIEDQNKVNTRTEPGNSTTFEEPVGVFQEVYNTDYSSPGFYVESSTGQLTFFQNITEDYAWENDVWVIGEEENVSSGNMIPAVEDLTLNGGRVNGEAEKGGILQVTNLNALEHWTAGKFEFKYFVHNAFGTEIKKRAFGKTKRKYFRDKKWYDYNDFIANWNTANIGNWMIESWIEEDYGEPLNVSNTFPAPCTGCPTTTISYSIKEHDEEMDRSMVQFTDSKSQVYNISYANFKRK